MNVQSAARHPKHHPHAHKGHKKHPHKAHHKAHQKHHHKQTHHAAGSGASKLHKISTRHGLLVPQGWSKGKAALESLTASGALAPASLKNLPLNQKYVPHTDSSGMKNRKPGGFEWDAVDQQTRAWWPQAVTTSSDANAQGTIDGQKWVAASWHSGDNKRSRISFANYTDPNDPATAKYRHVELMIPDPKHPGKLAPLALHVGGISWVGHYMYVADTHGGLRVFDVNQISQVKDPNVVPKGTAPFVMTQIGAYKLPPQAKHHKDTPVFSGLSLDRATGTLVSEEFKKHGKTGGVIARWPIDLSTGLLKTKNGVVHATQEYKSPVKKMAGVLARGDGFDIVSMGKPRSHLLHVGMGKKGTVKDTMWRAAQQLAWDAQLHQIWSLGEMRGHRAVWHFIPE